MNCLFYVKWKPNAKLKNKIGFDTTENKVKVFAVKNNKDGFATFLIYNKGQWRYVSAKHFEPIDVINL